MRAVDHYKEAEHLMEVAAGNHGHPVWLPNMIVAAAQVHATLALAGATAINGPNGIALRDQRDWLHAAGDYGAQGVSREDGVPVSELIGGGQ